MLLKATSVIIMKLLGKLSSIRCWLVHAKLCTFRKLWTHPWSQVLFKKQSNDNRPPKEVHVGNSIFVFRFLSDYHRGLQQLNVAMWWLAFNLAVGIFLKQSQMPDPRSVKGINATSNNLDNTELIEASL